MQQSGLQPTISQAFNDPNTESRSLQVTASTGGAGGLIRTSTGGRSMGLSVNPAYNPNRNQQHQSQVDNKRSTDGKKNRKNNWNSNMNNSNKIDPNNIPRPTGVVDPIKEVGGKYHESDKYISPPTTTQSTT